ncbi:MAG: phosphotransferase, partial [Myxococcota bacterium]
ERADHRLFADVASIAEALRVAAGHLPPLPELAPRPCHGDLKLSNVLFRGPEAHCLIDLDTLAPMHLGYEVGDALRSWCNPHREDEAGRASFELPFFSAAWTGYARGRAQPIPEAERRAVLYGVEHVCLELTARFLGDALLERYFGFDPQRYPGRGEHNLARARGQWALFRAVQACREARARVLDL